MQDARDFIWQQPESKVKSGLTCLYVLISINVAAFLLTLHAQQFAISNLWLSASAFRAGMFWQPLTAMFMHDGFGHIFSNMCGLFFFGGIVAQRIGGWLFFVFYMTVGLFSNLLWLAIMWNSHAYVLCGASGAVMGVTAVAAIMQPDMPVIVPYCPLPIKLRTMAIGYFIVEIVMQITGLQPGISHLVHIFGFVFGYLFLKLFLRHALNPIKAFYIGIWDRIFQREVLAFCAAAFFLGGSLALLWRLAFTEYSFLVLIISCVMLFLAAPVCAMYRAMLLTPPEKKLLVWLDADAHCGGLLAASLETDCSMWLGRIKPPRTPELSMQFPAARLIALLISVVFFVTAFLIDTGKVLGPDSPGSLDVHEEQKELESKLEILEQEPLAPQEEIAAAKEALDELVENSSGTSPAKAFEGIEALRDLTDSLAANAARALEHSAENFQRLSQAASALAALPPDVPGRTKALEQLKQLAEQLAADDAALAEFLKQSGDNLAASMTPEQLQSLADAMAGNAQDLRERLEKLAQARRDQMQGGQGGQGQDGGETGLANDSDYENSAEALQQWLEENAPGASELSDAAGQGQGNGNGNGDGTTPGSGGISRGRGDALLNFTGETQDVGDKRRELMLDNNTPGQSVSILEFATSPGEETAERAKAGKLSGEGQAAEHAETRILPSHRESVRRYFNNSPDQP